MVSPIENSESRSEFISEWKPFLGAVVTGVALPLLFRVWRETPWSHLLMNRKWQWKKEGLTLAYELALRIPGIRRMVEAEVRKEILKYEKQFEEKVRSSVKMERMPTLPEEGMSPDKVLSRIPQAELPDLSKVSGVYYGPLNNPELEELQNQMMARFAKENPLHPDLAPSLGGMERQIVAWCGNLFGLERAYGCVTSGGTESLLLVSLAAKLAKGVRSPNIVMPSTGHSAFHKAGKYFNIEIREVPVDADGRAVPKKMLRAIDSNTILLVGSAPSYAYGSIDPISELAAIALKKNIPMHVDCCLGGFVLPFLKQSGDEFISDFDFSLRGVTSISADTHKFGYAPKGSSVVLYRDKALYQHQIFTDPDWNGGMNTTPTLLGSRSGAPIASAWATLQYHGQKGYREAAKNIAYVTRKIAEGPIPKGLEVVGSPLANVVAFRSDPKIWNEKDVWKVSTLMNKDYGWELSTLQKYPAFHLCVTLRHAETRDMADKFVTQFLDDLHGAAAKVAEDPSIEIEGTAKAYGGTAEYPAPIVDRALKAFMTAQTCYSEPLE